jgi:hypothetical protein
MSWVGRAREVVLTAIASSASLVVCAVVLEVGLRIHKGALFRFGDLRATDVFGSETPAQHDSLLGYVLRPGVHEIGDQSATVDDASLRVTPLPESARGRPILVVGDSFTFGAEVRDHETWPAYLAGLLERPVVNGGVPGYGIDQAILRAEQLLPRVAFEFVVVTYISGDVDRAEYAYLYSWKPYFQTEGGRLELRNVPVPEVDYKGSLSWRIAGRSAAMQAVLRRAVPDWWYFKQPRIHRDWAGRRRWRMPASSSWRSADASRTHLGWLRSIVMRPSWACRCWIWRRTSARGWKRTRRTRAGSSNTADIFHPPRTASSQSHSRRS